MEILPGNLIEQDSVAVALGACIRKYLVRISPGLQGILIGVSYVPLALTDKCHDSILK
jgi:hypothetical protein